MIQLVLMLREAEQDWQHTFELADITHHKCNMWAFELEDKYQKSTDSMQKCQDAWGHLETVSSSGCIVCPLESTDKVIYWLKNVSSWLQFMSQSRVYFWYIVSDILVTCQYCYWTSSLGQASPSTIRNEHKLIRMCS